MAEAAERFAPAGWRVETQARGDLDGDGRVDLALILLPASAVVAPPDAAVSEGPPPRRLFAVALGRVGGGYRLVLQDGTFLPPMRPPNGLSEGYMLFQDGSIEMHGGRLRILFQYTRASTTFTFAWEDDALRLIGYDSAAVSGGCFHGLGIDYLTRRARLEAGWVDREEALVRWRDLPAGSLPAFDEIGEGEMLDPFGLLSGFPLSCPERR